MTPPRIRRIPAPLPRTRPARRSAVAKTAGGCSYRAPRRSPTSGPGVHAFAVQQSPQVTSDEPRHGPRRSARRPTDHEELELELIGGGVFSPPYAALIHSVWTVDPR